MAPKSTLFLIVFVLMVTKMGSSMEEFDSIETEKHHHHHHHAPTKAPIHSPTPAPFHAPTKNPVYVPAHAPIYSPTKAPAYAPHGCVAMCSSYCKPISPKRPCMRTCTACCAKFKCVPRFTKCDNWDKVAIRGYLVKCP